MPKIISPESKRPIEINGPTYIRLSKDKKFSKKLKTAAVIPSTKKSKGVGRGGKTKGWKNDAPSRGSDRVALKAKCGSKCFLKPSTNGFPVCKSLKKDGNCKIDCRGIIAAKIRSKEWSYVHVREIADKLGKKYNC